MGPAAEFVRASTVSVVLTLLPIVESIQERIKRVKRIQETMSSRGRSEPSTPSTARASQRPRRDPRHSKTKEFRCALHGSIKLEPLLVDVMDTAAFQRLKRLKQLGVSDHVYMTAVHSRFEHSVGVARARRKGRRHWYGGGGAPPGACHAKATPCPSHVGAPSEPAVRCIAARLRMPIAFFLAAFLSRCSSFFL